MYLVRPAKFIYPLLAGRPVRPVSTQEHLLYDNRDKIAAVSEFINNSGYDFVELLKNIEAGEKASLFAVLLVGIDAVENSRLEIFLSLLVAVSESDIALSDANLVRGYKYSENILDPEILIGIVGQEIAKSAVGLAKEGESLRQALGGLDF